MNGNYLWHTELLGCRERRIPVRERDVCVDYIW